MSKINNGIVTGRPQPQPVPRKIMAMPKTAIEIMKKQRQQIKKTA